MLRRKRKKSLLNRLFQRSVAQLLLADKKFFRPDVEKGFFIIKKFICTVLIVPGQLLVSRLQYVRKSL